MVKLHLADAIIAKLNNFMKDLIEKGRAKIDGVYYCPHHPDFTGECDCRKPKPGMILQAKKDFSLEDLSECYMIGDKNGDLLCGKNAGCQTILVKTGYGGKGGDSFESVKADYVAEDLFEAVNNFILK